MAPTEKRTASKGGGLNLVWLFPILAAVAVGYMLYDSFSRRGPVVEIAFQSAVGVVVEKTPIRYQGVRIGMVGTVQPDPENDRVMVEVRLDRGAELFAQEGAQFWIEYPQIGLDGVKSLDTLISGPYIAALPGSGAGRVSFEGALQRPPGAASESGLRLTLLAESVDSVRRDSPVMFKGIDVGFVDSVEYADDTERVAIGVVIDEAFRELVRGDATFWESSGLSVRGSLQDGVSVEYASVRSVVNGGISFAVPEGSDADAVTDGHTMRLFPNEAAAMSSRSPVVAVAFESAVGIVAERTPVRYQGVQVGVVTKIGAEPARGRAIVEVRLDHHDPAFASEGARYWIEYPAIGLGGVRSLETLISGPYIAVLPGTGEPSLSFEGEQARPAGVAATGDLKLTLLAESVDSVRRDSPVLFKGIEVGAVDAVTYSEESGRVSVQVVIQQAFRDLVRKDSAFWESSGLDISASLQSGVNIDSSSLRSVLNGGISFSNPRNSTADPAEHGDEMPLFASEAESMARFVTVSIEFGDATGIVPDLTPVRYRGVDVGTVTGVRLSESLGSVEVIVDLLDRYRRLAVQNTRFWIVRPKIDLSGVESIETLTSGSYIALIAGSGQPHSTFTGLEAKPRTPSFGPGLDVVLQTASLGRVTVDAPVFYRQTVVGRVSAVDLASDGSRVNVFLSIDPRYAPLVRVDSRFWKVGGIQVKAGLANFEVDFETIESVIKGGIAFATPPQQPGSTTLTDGQVFSLEEEPQQGWLDWVPGVQLEPGR